MLKKSRRKKSQKIQAKKKLGQKLLQTLSKNRFKIQNNNPKNGAARGARRPIFGASARGASVVVLNFVSVFCKGLQELLAQLFFGLDVFLTFSFDFFSTFFPSKKAFFWSTDHQKSVFSKIIFSKTDIFQNCFFQNRFFPKIGFAKTVFFQNWFFQTVFSMILVVFYIPNSRSTAHGGQLVFSIVTYNVV